MKGETLAMLSFGVAALVFLGRLHMDMANVKERLARIEGWIEGRFSEGAGT